MATERRLDGELGQSLVEAALILPVLILCLTAIIEIGWVIFNRVNFDNMAIIAVRANPKTEQGEAADFLTYYIQDNYSGYGANGITLDVETEVNEYFYNEYVWKSNQRKHWEVPMYFKVLYTKMEAACDLPYLTPFGKVIFQSEGDTFPLKTDSIAVRTLENNSIAATQSEDEDDENM